MTEGDPLIRTRYLGQGPMERENNRHVNGMKDFLIAR